MMRPTTPNFNFAHQAGPSSPPQTPTTPSFPYRQYKTRRNGMYFSQPPSANIDIANSLGQSHTPFYNQSSELSPRSSSPTSSTHSSHLSPTPPPPRSLSSSPGAPMSSLPSIKTRIIAETKANFTVEEFGESDYEDFDSETDSIIRPTQYEDAESDHAPSIKSQSQAKAKQIDPIVLAAFNKLQCDNSEDEDYNTREAYIQLQRAEKRRKRRSSGSFKRTLAQSIGSDTDEEDLVPGVLDANDAGSSARRLRRRTGERSSLIFDDPPPRIDELEEPESCEEVVEVVVGEDEEREGLARNLPYWIQEDMDLDTSSDEEDSDED